MRVAVIGAGVLGAAVSRELVRLGAQVRIYERHQPASGSSASSFAWINARDRHPHAYHELTVEAMAAHRALVRQFNGRVPWWAPTGSLEWEPEPDARGRLLASVQRLTDLGHPVRWVTAAQASTLEPDLAPAMLPQAGPIALFPDDGYARPALLIAHLLGDAASRGLELQCPAEVRGLEVSPSAVQLLLGGGAHAGVDRADVVVVCAGRWASHLLRTVGYDLPLVQPDEPGSRALGLLASARAPAVRLERVLVTPSALVRPDGGGRLLVHAPDLDGVAAPGRPPPRWVGRAVADRLGRLLPRYAGRPVPSVQVAHRSLPVDGLPICGFIDQTSKIYPAVTHHGITLAPLLGSLVAREIVTGQPSEKLEPFRPGRFRSPAGAHPACDRVVRGDTAADAAGQISGEHRHGFVA